MPAKIEIPLDIEGVDIKDVIFTKQDEIVIVVESLIEATKCHRCGQVITKYHLIIKMLQQQRHTGMDYRYPAYMEVSL